MKTYEFCLNAGIEYYFSIEAETQDEAIALAEEEAESATYDFNCYSFELEQV